MASLCYFTSTEQANGAEMPQIPAGPRAALVLTLCTPIGKGARGGKTLVQQHDNCESLSLDLPPPPAWRTNYAHSP